MNRARSQIVAAGMTVHFSFAERWRSFPANLFAAHSEEKKTSRHVAIVQGNCIFTFQGEKEESQRERAGEREGTFTFGKLVYRQIVAIKKPRRQGETRHKVSLVRFFIVHDSLQHQILPRRKKTSRRRNVCFFFCKILRNPSARKILQMTFYFLKFKAHGRRLGKCEKGRKLVK